MQSLSNWGTKRIRNTCKITDLSASNSMRFLNPHVSDLTLRLPSYVIHRRNMNIILDNAINRYALWFLQLLSEPSIPNPSQRRIFNNILCSQWPLKFSPTVQFSEALRQSHEKRHCTGKIRVCESEANCVVVVLKQNQYWNQATFAELTPHDIRFMEKYFTSTGRGQRRLRGGGWSALRIFKIPSRSLKAIDKASRLVRLAKRRCMSWLGMSNKTPVFSSRLVIQDASRR